MVLQTEEQRRLIEKFVKSNVRFSGNEDLLDDFCNEAFQKSYIVFKSDSGIEKVESYVSKVVNTSIMTVLKDAGRLKKTSGGYIKTREVSLDAIRRPEPVTPPVVQRYQDVPESYDYDIEDPRSMPEETLIRKELLQKIADSVCVIHNSAPNQSYLELFEYRYIKGMKQREIAESLQLSQAEVSKRLIELSKLIKVRLNT